MCSGTGIVIREVAPHDLGKLVDLCAEHAEFERTAYDREGKRELLQRAFSGNPPLLAGWVAAHGKSLVGYATATIDFSTWSAERFMHLDCLYVREPHRRSGLGKRLLQAVVDDARRRGVRELQWQTPAWNTAADRFYRRLGAVARPKLRYILQVDEMVMTSESIET